MMDWIKCEIVKPPKDKPFLGVGLDGLNEETEIIIMIYYPGGIDDDGYDTMEGYFALGKWGKYNAEHSCNPTHWLPLPNQPVDKK
jgi:hypothetical protein